MKKNTDNRSNWFMYHTIPKKTVRYLGSADKFLISFLIILLKLPFLSPYDSRQLTCANLKFRILMKKIDKILHIVHVYSLMNFILLQCQV